MSNERGERGPHGDHGQDGRRGDTGRQGIQGPPAEPQWYSITDRRLLIMFVLVTLVGLIGFYSIDKNAAEIAENAYKSCAANVRLINTLNDLSVIPDGSIEVPVCRRP